MVRNLVRGGLTFLAMETDRNVRADKKHPFLFALMMVFLFFLGVHLGASPILLGVVIGLFSLSRLIEAKGGISGNREAIGDLLWGLSVIPMGFLAAGAFMAPVFGVLVYVFDVSPDLSLGVLAYPFVWLGLSLSIGIWSRFGASRDLAKGRPYSGKAALGARFRGTPSGKPPGEAQKRVSGSGRPSGSPTPSSPMVSKRAISSDSELTLMAPS